MMKRFGQLGMLATAAKMVQRQLASRKPAGAATTTQPGASRPWDQAAQRFRARKR